MGILVSQKEDVEIQFPCLMYAPHFDKIQIILATGKSKYDGFIGTNVNGVGWTIGNYCDGWSSNFKPYNGSITLKNEIIF